MSGKIELPRNSETIGKPRELAAEPIVREWHQGSSTVEEGGDIAMKILLTVAIHKKRERRRERKGVLNRAIDARDRLISDLEGRLMD